MAKGNSNEYGDDKGRGARATDAKTPPRSTSTNERKMVADDKSRRSNSGLAQGIGRRTRSAAESARLSGNGKEAQVKALATVLGKYKGNGDAHDDKQRGARATEPRASRGNGRG